MSDELNTTEAFMWARDNQHDVVAQVLQETLEGMFNNSAFDGFDMIPEPVAIEQTPDIWAVSFQSLADYETDKGPITIDHAFRIHALRNGDVYMGIADDYSNRIASGASIELDAFENGMKLTNIHNYEKDPDKSVDLAVVQIIDEIASMDVAFGEAYTDYISSLPTPP